MKKYSDLIRDKKKRTLSAKGYKFQTRLIDIACNQRGLTRYHKEMKPIKDKIKEITHYLIIDKEMGLNEVKEIISKRKLIEKIEK